MKMAKTVSEYRVLSADFEEMKEALRWVLEKTRSMNVVSVDCQLMIDEEEETAWITATVTAQVDG